MTKKYKLLISSSFLATTVALIPISIVSCGTIATDMNQTQASNYAKIEPEALKDFLKPTAISKAEITNDNAVSELATLGIDLNFTLKPTVLNDFKISSYSITAVNDTSVNIFLSGKSGTTDLDTTPVEVKGFKTEIVDMNQEQLNDFLKISTEADRTKTIPAPTNTDVKTIDNRDATSKLAELGINITFKNQPTALKPFVVKSYSISANPNSNTSVKVSIKGTSGDSNLNIEPVVVSGFSSTFIENNIEYEILNNSTKEVAIKNSTHQKPQENLEIKSKIKHNEITYKITKIGSKAFYNKNFTGTLTLPDTITSIEDNAFNGNEFSGTLNVKNVNSIGDYAFYKNKFSKTLTLGDKLSSIGEFSFSKNKFSGNLIIPDSVTSIGNSAFSDNEFGGSLTIGAGIQLIGNNVFSSTSISIFWEEDKENVQNGFIYYQYKAGEAKIIGWNKNTGATDLTIPDTINDLKVTSIGANVFDNKQFKGTLIIGQNVAEIGSNAFSGNSFTKLENKSSLSEKDISGLVLIKQ